MLHVFRCTPFFILLLVVNVLSIYYINDTSSYGKLKYQSLIKPTVSQNSENCSEFLGNIEKSSKMSYCMIIHILDQ